jgi:hypothetical protein
VDGKKIKYSISGVQSHFNACFGWSWCNA